MITQNVQKKALVEKLLHDKAISLDDALLLLDNPFVGNGKSYTVDELPSYPFTYQHPGTLSIDPGEFRTTCSDTMGKLYHGSTLTGGFDGTGNTFTKTEIN